MTMFLTQLGLNVFGSMDILPFTGVTFPFVSRGGSSLLSCWMMIAFLKSADTRRDASFAVRPGEHILSLGDRLRDKKDGKGTEKQKAPSRKEMRAEKKAARKAAREAARQTARKAAMEKAGAGRKT